MVSLFHNSCGPVFAVGAILISGGVLWPYVAGGSILITGLATASKNKCWQASGFNKFILFGPMLLAIAIAIFGADHLTAAKSVAQIVPPWMPGRLFWTYFVGVALIAAAMSLATGINRRLAAALLGIMIFLFVLMIHIPSCFTVPYDKTRLTIVLRDLTLSAGALAFAATQAEHARARRTPGQRQRFSLQTLNSKVITIARFLIAISIAVFGVDEFLYPTFAPGIPQEGPAFVTMPAWIPGHVFWAYLTGILFVVCAIGLMSRKHARSAATVLGLTVLILALFVYLPLTVVKASDIANGLNYLAIHFALSGAAFLLAGALPVKAADQPAAAELR
jgi:uncharacterized membrane protein